ncbi:MAG: DUF1549 and DUF1553 domain-containing protein, partial [Planctomycetes bacterium]|nr:DUF1549 and DUF1553 domain-containing protein [Planctomycetota bacterium]
MRLAHRSTFAGVSLLAASAVLAAAAFVAAPSPPFAFAGDATGGSALAPSTKTPREVAADIDQLVVSAWEKEGLKPAPKCSDAEFVRRAYLDIVGTIPTALETDDFLSDPSSRKREKLVDDLLASPGYARHFAAQWSDVLVGNGTGDQKRDFVPGLFLQWMEKQFASDRPYAVWVKELLTADGSPYTNSAVNFTARKDFSPTDLAGAVSKSFLGVQIQCAQCHDHPYEELTQKDFQGFSAFWGRLWLKQAEIPVDMFGARFAAQMNDRLDKQVAEMVKTGIPEAEARIRAERQKLRTKEVGDLAGDAKIPKAYMEGKLKGLGEASKAEPKFLKAATYQDRAGETRREALARWITDASNPYTARTLANRTWGWFLGRGIVHPVDDFNSVNVPVVPEALDLL